ncbi:hypothetical protein [Cellulomonas sp. KRMCY2]|uniref:hypothetical protein n=1 Tax=Cellulomonas sp. KRMCY2 TaxID=1304865 RepID=UPI00045E9372|nr:hypothetical protein [Cellulomonas sp. KRMCY2]
MIDLRDALSGIQDAAGDAGGPAPTEAILARRRRRRAARAIGGTLVGAAVIGAVVLVAPSLLGPVEVLPPVVTESPSPSPEPSTTPDPTPGTPETPETPSPDAEPATDPTTSTMPLKDPSTRFDGAVSIVSAIPDSEDSLADGDYFGFLHGADAAARTVSVDIGIFYGGEAADEYVRVNEPEFWAAEGGTVPNGYFIVNDVERVREIPVSPDVTVANWCFSDGLDVISRDFAQWATATRVDMQTCDDPDPTVWQGNDLYWFDVRDGVVMQIVGQYVP